MVLPALVFEMAANGDRHVAHTVEIPVPQHEVEQAHRPVVHHAVAAVGESSRDRGVVNRSMGSDLVVEEGCAALHVVDGHHQAVG